MASPGYYPPLRPRRSLSGPIVLIALGILFLLGNLHVLGWESLGYWFAHYWPVLLILWGAIKLVEYQQAQHAGARAAGIGFGSVLLILLLIGLGLSATHVSSVNWDELRDHIHFNDMDDIPILGQSYAYDDQVEQVFPDDGSLHINSERGAINVNVADGKQIHVMIHKHIRASSQSEADKWNAGTKPLLAGERTLTLNSNTQAAGNHWVSTDMDISLPRKASLVINARRGDVTVTGRDGNLDITTQHGDVTAEDINGNISLNLQHSSARLSQVSGTVAVDGNPNDVSLSDVKGAVRLAGEFDTLKLSKISSPVSFRSGRTDLSIARVDGDLDLDSDNLSANELVGPVRLNTSSKEIRMLDISGDVRLQNEDGDVELRMSKLGSVQVENKNNDVQIYLPEKAAFQIDARARNGEIQSDFPEIKIENGDEQGTATGKVGSDGAKIVLNNEHAGIDIRRGSTVAEAPAPPQLPRPPHSPPRVPSVPEPTEN